jgi:hypothetical protein
MHTIHKVGIAQSGIILIVKHPLRIIDKGDAT